jgi:3-oxoacyl-[acyl-carrier protein] reductase
MYRPEPAFRATPHAQAFDNSTARARMSAMAADMGKRRIALVTGVSRTVGIGAAVAARLLRDGLDVAASGWSPYDERMPWGRDEIGDSKLAGTAAECGSRVATIAADLGDPSSIPFLFDDVETQLGRVDVLVLCHCESVATDLLTTSIESFDEHFAVNARASWLLIREFAQRFESQAGAGRIVALTSDATVGNMPYGASKGALDRIVLAAACELAHLGVTANVINPGPTNTGWMDAKLKATIASETPLRRLGMPTDASNLVSFLCSVEGAWVNGQMLHSDGGLHAR